MTTPAIGRRGRPRDPDLQLAVLRATTALLGERGYHRLRVGDVAERAGVGLGALYRRWPSKRDLVLAALAHAAPDADVPATDDPAADVIAGLQAIADGLAGPEGRVLTGLLSDLADDPDLAAAVRETMMAPLRAQHRRRLHRLTGERPDLAVRADLGLAYVFFQGVVLGHTVTTAELGALLPTLAGATGEFP